MTSVYNNSVINFYNWVFDDLADPRTNDWFLIKSPFPGLTIIAVYLYFVRSWGPRFMENRKPYDLNSVLIVYNFLQIFISSLLVYEGVDAIWLRPEFSFSCHPVDFAVNDTSMREARIVHLYFFAKISEFLDTVFFVLRKKENQITFLHLYHHVSMVMISWGCTKYYPGGHGTFVGIVNSFVHIIMYTYYMLAACGPQLQRYLWWKKYITVLQMVQFLSVFIHSAQLLWVPCDYPTFSIGFTMPGAVFFIYLFNDFYSKAYNQLPGKAQLEAEETPNKVQDNNNLDNGRGKLDTQEEGADVKRRVIGKVATKNGAALQQKYKSDPTLQATNKFEWREE